MTAPHVLTLDAPVGAEAVQQFLPVLAASLVGEGPALLPLPPGLPDIRQQLLHLAEPEAPLEAPGIALLVPTSGTSGPPKLAMLPAAAICASVDATHLALGGPGRWLLALPTTHVAGLQVLARSVVSGFSPVVVDTTDGFTPRGLVDAAGQLLDDIGPEPRYAALVPTQLHRVLEAGGAAVAALMALDAVLLGGASPGAQLVQRAHEAGITLVQTYGMTETCGGCIYDGVPLTDVRVSFGERNRIHLSGPILFAGYRGDLAHTQETLDHGIFRSNDFGHLDEHGRLVVDGRLDDVVVTGGVNVSPTAVEYVLAQCPGVRALAVVGVPDDEWGQRVVAVAVADATLTLDALKTFAQGQLDPAAVPRQLVVVDELPLLATGKHDRASIEELVRGSS